MGAPVAGQTDPPFVLPIEQIVAAQFGSVGGKAAQLAELSRIEGVRVPPGFCVSTDALWTALAATPSLGEGIDELSRCNPDDRDALHGTEGYVELLPSAEDADD